MRVILGYKGQVGSALAQIAKDAGLEFFGIEKNQKWSKSEIGDVQGLHCCIPFSDNFVDAVQDYIAKLDPKITIIHSTVLPGTTSKIYHHFKRKKKIYYSPTRGQHDHMYSDMRRYRKFIAAPYRSPVSEGIDELTAFNFLTRVTESVEALELVKLLDTTQFAVLIAWAQEAERFCKDFGASFDLVRNFGRETQRFYGLRPDIFPGVAGGHCLMPNVKILQRIRKSKILDFIVESNNKKKKDEQKK